eukprot:TRINITY_DN2306_c0_g2_i1.p1 TRINITY_DN2306_c0_g2~~TRINITY_DN2306_c0_g2_i1.p1  ORF type:complete len:332 (-),score=61.43 TRINITY_DN2306_c0_g2_i1:55-1050(-)
MSYWTHDFEKDAGWKEYLNKVSVVSDQPDIMEKIRKRYYKREVNPEWEELKDPKPNSSPASNNNTSEPKRSSNTNSSSSQRANSPPPQRTNTAPRGGTTHPSPFDNGLLSKKSVWFFANVSVIVHSILYIIPIIDTSAGNYRRALFSAMVTYGIVLLSTFNRFPGLSLEAWAPIFMNENTHYFLMCLIFMNTSMPISIGLFPLTIYAFFHVLDNTRGYIQKYPKLETYAAKAKEYQAQALLVVAQIEIFVMLLLIFLLFTGNGSIISVFMYFQFLQYRYVSSTYSKLIWNNYGAKLDQWINHPIVPSIIRTLYFKVKGLIARVGQPPAHRR